MATPTLATFLDKYNNCHEHSCDLFNDIPEIYRSNFTGSDIFYYIEYVGKFGYYYYYKLLNSLIDHKDTWPFDVNASDDVYKRNTIICYLLNEIYKGEYTGSVKPDNVSMCINTIKRFVDEYGIEINLIDNCISEIDDNEEDIITLPQMINQVKKDVSIGFYATYEERMKARKNNNKAYCKEYEELLSHLKKVAHDRHLSYKVQLTEKDNIINSLSDKLSDLKYSDKDNTMNCDEFINEDDPTSKRKKYIKDSS